MTSVADEEALTGTDDHGIRSWEMLHRTVQALAAREDTQLGIRMTLPEESFEFSRCVYRS